MKNRIIKCLTSIACLLIMSVEVSAAITKPWGKGAFQTGKYRNVFAEMGYSQQAIDAKVNEVFHGVFEGPNKIYFTVGDSMAYISDIKNHDVRTEGMSYGMMIAVQFNRKDIFDRLWRWGKKYMQLKDGPSKGYFAWSCKTDGTHNAEGPASDGELYYITSLIFASNRWGDTSINYLAEAQYILNSVMEKRGEQGVTPLINPQSKIITFVPSGFGSRFTDPSYNIPAFYEVWARWADDGRSEYWKECEKTCREYLHKAINPSTGLNPDYSNFNGTLISFRGRGIGDAFRYDSWRVPMNIALDYSWSCADKEWQQEYGNKIQNFFYSQGIDSFVDQYNVDGTPVKEIMEAGDHHKALLHSVGLVGTLAAVSLTCTHEKSSEFIERLWNSKHVPYADGYFDAYYDGLLRLFAFMHLSGKYKIITPNMK